MKKNRMILFILICIILFLLPFGIKVLATEGLTSNTTSAQLETIALRQGGAESSGTIITTGIYDTTPYSYKIGGINVLKIIQKDDSNYTDMLYCINASGSFPTVDTSSGATSFTYNNVGDFTNINDSYVKEWFEKVGMTEDTYNALVYLLNNIYLMKQNTEYKTTFIKNAFESVIDETTFPPTTVATIMETLTDDDIDVIQQWAIWYFTNGSNENNYYYKLSYSDLQTINIYSVTGEEQQLGSERIKYAGILYTYLIESAEEAVDKYGYTAGDSNSYPSLDKTTTITSEVEGRYYKVGPFKVNSSGTDIPSDFNLSLKFYDESGTELQNVSYEIYIDGQITTKSYDEIFDEEYYIYLPVQNNQVSTIKLSYEYSDRKITLWQGDSSENLNLQEVVLITEDKVEDKVSVDITEAVYDLALRKYIVSINGDATSGREPQVSGLDALKNGTSKNAVYEHTKDALQVKVGDKVVYEFRVYNEGNVDAESIEIVDYIPAGLKVVSNSTTNTKYNWQTETSVNGYTKVTSTVYTDKDNNTGSVIKAFNGSELDYAVFQIECEVTDEAVSGQIIKNIAEITVDDGDDRDSVPENLTPSASFTGVEDDDDYEQIIPVIPEGNYQIKLKKVDQDGNTITSEAGFSWEISNGTSGSGTTSGGELSLGTVQITDVNTQDTITITETSAPSGYTALINSITITVDKAEEDGEYVVSGISTITSEAVEGLKVELDGNVITITVPNEKIEGDYELKLQKVDEKGNLITTSSASFKWTLPDGTSKTGLTSNGELSLGTVEITDVSEADTITITETSAPEGYIALIDSITIQVTKTEDNGEYVIDKATITSDEIDGVDISLNGQVITIIVPNEKIEGEYKLKLQKVDEEGNLITTSEADFSWTLPDGTSKTGSTSEGQLDLGTVEITDVSEADTITITETSAPQGYKALIDSITIEVNKTEQNGEYVIDGEPTITSGEEEGVDVSVDGNVITVTVPNKLLEGEYELRLQKVDEEGNIIATSEAEFSWVLPDGEKQMGSTTNGELSLGTVEIEDIENPDEITITEIGAPEGYNALIDSITLEVSKTEKDGEYIVEEVTITSEEVEGIEVNLVGNVITITVPNEKIVYDYDLHLRKYIVSVDNEATSGREPEVSGLEELAEGNSTDAVYTHSKDAITVREGSKIIYEFRIYNEGEVDATVGEIVDYIPEGLKLVSSSESTINSNYNWQEETENGYTKITSTYLSGTVIPAFDKENLELSCISIQVELEVEEGLENGTVLKNIAEITVDDGDDIDSEPDNVTPTPEFTGEEDDDDYEEVVVFIPDGSYELRLQKVDEEGNLITTSEAEFSWVLPDGTSETGMTTNGELSLGTVEIEDVETLDEITITEIEAPEGYNALIESITIEVSKTEEDDEYIVDEVTITSEDTEGVEVSLVGNIITITVPNKPIEKNFDLALQKFITGLNDEEVTGREPIVTIDEEGNIVYTNTPDALYVGNGDLVVYTIRIYNEGDTAGYAAEITDDIPTGLKFVSDNEINIAYGWEMIDSEGNVTEDEEEAVAVRTTYLSKESSEDNLLEAYDEELGLSYKDVQIVFQVDESAIDKTVDTEARTIINTAEITEDTDENGDEIDDIDSTPGNWESGEDDIDQEQVYVKYFDLALEKTLGSAVVTVDGVSTSYNATNGTVRVEVNRKKVDSTTIQFYFTITITNEGEIAGYATEITDYIPDGLYFEASDNSEWTQVSEKEITTNALAKTLLEPGESASVQVILRWEQSSENMGQFINIAEISDDWNEYDSPDIDSTPDNQVPTEDDYDTAPVWVSISTGLLENGPYIILTATVLAILGTGIFLIKKYVL